MPFAAPKVCIGQYYVTPPWWSKIKCKAYDAPPLEGKLITTISPSTYLGPVEDSRVTTKFVTICVRGYWINVWGARQERRIAWPEDFYFTSYYGDHYAHLVEEQERRSWRDQGWIDHHYE